MADWIVIEYERINVQRFNDTAPRYMAGDPIDVKRVEAKDEDQAIDVIRGERDGIFAAVRASDVELRYIMWARPC